MSVLPADIPTAVTPDEAEFLREHAAGRIVLEIGANYGYSSVVMGHVAKLVVSIDHHGGDDYHKNDSLPVFIDNLHRHGLDRKVFPVVGRSQDVGHLFAGVFSLAFIDGDHTYTGALADGLLCYDLVVPGGLIVFHDHAPLPLFPELDVPGAVEELCRQHPKLTRLEAPGTLAALRR